MLDVVRRTAESVFIPLTVGGGRAQSVDDVDTLLRAGADKVGVNTAAIARPELIAEIAERFGQQVLVLSLDVRRAGGHAQRLRGHHARRPARHRAGRGRVGAPRVAELGAGEILLNSMDADGTKAGFDLDADRGGARGGRHPGDRQRRRRPGRSTSRRRSPPAPTRCWRRACSTSES